MTRVVRPTVVNEMNFGYTHNRWGFKAADDFDYQSLYRSTLGIDPPRFEPFGAGTRIRRSLSGFGGSQVDEWPYAPRFATTGGNRSNLGNYRVGNGNIQSADEPIPRLNLSGRFVFSDDLSITKGRHNFKMGAALEYNMKTEPGSADYMGNFNFGHDANNPLSTGNGYANMMLGVFTTYTELTSRVDRDVRHWQNDFYFQDNWRISPDVDDGFRTASAAQRLGLRSQRHEQRLLRRSLESEPGRAGVPAGLHGRPPRQSGVRSEPPADD